MFEITGDDISRLGDADLRTLIGLLCEAEMRRQSLPTSSVTWGGSQTAKDGGLDVRVTLPAGTPLTGFFPNPNTGFQVKKPDMPRSEILDEMKPKGVLRTVITDLANISGAYIIVSSSGSTSDSALTSRRDAMADAIKGTLAEGNLSLDFYDRNRVATWVRDHAGLIPWVRSRIGNAVPGWKSYGSWSSLPENTDSSYLADEQARIQTGEKDEGDGIAAIEGINRIRQVLNTPGRVVRLVGLSGVGKTRLAEALFDPNVGAGGLDPSLAIYANIADAPNPPPAGLASDLMASQTRAILVVDNCSSELHRQLSEIARVKTSTISVLTIEYDIREDQPEGTDVFTLNTSSIALIEKLVARRYPDLSDVDAHTIAEFSGGNARVALALASRIEKTETISGLSEEELFRRLFQQRYDHDPLLLSIAQACSLVYSFEGESLSGEVAELPGLGSLIGKSADEMYAGVAELMRRDLVQARAQWRAVLPHAIANRLAKLALQNIPPSKVRAVLVQHASGRLLRSFSRRLGYLDESTEAKEIVQNWLSPGGLLGEITGLDELGQEILTNIAPVVPEVVLSAIESGLSGADEETLHRSTHFVHLLRSLAYEPAFFERALTLLVKFAALPSERPKDNEAASVVSSLFYVALSGTHAPIETRIGAAKRLLQSERAEIRLIGVKALESLMKTSHFSSHYEFDFGARSRDYGLSPKTGDDVIKWFEAALNLASEFAVPRGPLSDDVRAAIASEFRGLWADSGCAELLDQISRDIAGESFWREGWIAVRRTRTYEGSSLAPELLMKLTELEKFLRPKDLLSRVRGLVIGAGNGSIDFDDFDEDREGENKAKPDSAAQDARSSALIRELGLVVAADNEALRTLLPELMRGGFRVQAFGEALAEGVENPRANWDDMISQLAAMKDASLQLMGGFLKGVKKHDAVLADVLLDEAVKDEVLSTRFPILQASVTVDEHAVARLHRALDLGKAPIDAFYSLSYGGACATLGGPKFRDLVVAIARKPGGLSVGLQLISMRLYSDRSDKRETPQEVREAGRAILEAFEFVATGRASVDDHELGVVVRTSLTGPDGVAVARSLCCKLKAAVAAHNVSAHDYDDLVKNLLKVHPQVILDELFSGDAKSRRESMRLLQSLGRFRNIWDAVPDEVVLDWCERDPTVRFSIAASVVPLFKKPDGGGPHDWTSLPEKILQKAPDPGQAFNEIVRRLHPTSWTGSLASKLDRNLKLLSSMPGGNASVLADAMALAKSNLQAKIDAQRQLESEEDSVRNGRFE